VPALFENARIEQFELGLALVPPPVFLHQLRVRVCGLRIFVELLHVRMISRTVEIKVVLPHVFTVISLITRQAELPFLVDLLDRSPLFSARRLQHGEVLTGGLQVKVIVVEPAVGELAGRPELGAKMCANGERHFLDLGLQLTTTVIGVGAACSGAVLIRNRWPSADTSYE
jgi:hypothetical protein